MMFGSKLWEAKWTRIQRRLGALCDAEGIGRDDPVPERILREAGMTDDDLAKFCRYFARVRAAGRTVQ